MKLEKEFPNVDACNPRQCISGKMMRCNRRVANVFRKHLKPFNITDSQLSTLFIVTKAENVTQKTLSDMMFMEKSTVNRNLKRLIENDYITKLGVHELQTTNKGLQLLERVIPHWENAMTEIRTLLDEEGETAINTLLQKLI